jgi:citronellol/citronellal dehydrogenase
MAFSDFDLSGKVAIVTGGGTGIGQGMAMALAENGAAVVVASRNPAHLAETVSKIEVLGRRGLAIPTDVRDITQIYGLVEKTLEAFGQIDVLVTIHSVINNTL